jgi:probable F420-dependent oxidoreductase
MSEQDLHSPASGEAGRQFGRLGVFVGSAGRTGPSGLVDLARRLEGFGYGTLWLPESVATDPFVLAAFVLARTERITVATGIANIYARDPMATKAAAKTLALAAPGRFVLGLGVSSPKLVADVRGHVYEKPVPAMRSYLDAMEKALYRGPQPEREAPTVLAALGPRMLALARDRAAGAFPYLVTPEHTRGARAILGPSRWLCVEQMAVAEHDAARAREVGRKAVASYLTAPGYRDNLRRLGFTVEEMDARSDRLVDALVAWGGDDAIERRVDEHFTAGADHVCVQALRGDAAPGLDLDLLERLAWRSGVAPRRAAASAEASTSYSPPR